MDGKSSKRGVIAITGGCGNLATKLANHLDTLGYSVLLFDVAKKPETRFPVVVGDLRTVGAWTESFAGVDTVVHFAAQNPYPEATWTDSARSFDITANVFLAAMRAGVRRVVFASSNHVMGGHKESGVNASEAGPLTPLTPPFPGTKVEFPPASDATPYATAKLFGERLAAALAATGRTSFYCLRIGWCQPGANRPATMTPTGTLTLTAQSGAADADGSTLRDPRKLAEWFQLMWLSNRDFLQVFQGAIEARAAPGGFAVLNAMSQNTGMRWDVSTTRRVLGYSPKDDVTIHKRPYATARRPTSKL